MGIRYDNDSRRATNGPLIFFSDPSSLEAVSEEIRAAVNIGLSFYCYRLPDSSMLSFGSSESYIEGLSVPGFVIGMFDPTLPIITIPYSCIKDGVKAVSLYNKPDTSTTFEEYEREVQGIIRDLSDKKDSKAVASRIVVKEYSIDLAEKFFDFCQRFPDAMVFCFSTPATGCWIGASPELLLQGDESGIASMALAGTREVDDGNMIWDEKNIQEQRIVKDYILKVFEHNGLIPIEGETYTKTAGSIEHICTPVYGEIRDPKFDLEKFLKQFSPTPALCGNPKEFALSLIKKYEKFDRGCYGGFCGPFHSLKDFTFNVVLRCASVTERLVYMYAGGGITSLSNVSAEWKETDIKLQNMRWLQETKI